MSDSVKKTYLQYFKGFELTSMAVATLLFEGECPEAVKLQEQQVYDVAKKHGGIPGGEENGKRGYMLTFVIAYIRVSQEKLPIS
jgi:alkyldihydroxyacetonephosphate synthase